MTTLQLDPAEAVIIRVQGRKATIRCPFCHRDHTHEVRQHGAQHFAPACGMYRSPDDRGRGYRFTTGATGRPNRKDTTNG